MIRYLIIRHIIKITSRFPSEAILECEDILKHDPENIEPLLFLSKYHCARKEINSSLKYIGIILNVDPDHVETLNLKLTILMYQKKYKQMIDIVEAIRGLDFDRFELYHQFGIVYLALEQFEESVSCFYRAYHNTENDLVQKKIKFIIRRIHAQIEE